MQTELPAPDAGASTGRRGISAGVVFWLLCFSSIGILQLHLPGWLGMYPGGLIVLAVATCGIVGIAWRAVKLRDTWLTDRIRIGLVGGLWGTVGYDVFRIPFHLSGLNPFAPIRAYGLWLCGAEASTVATDAAGYVYHLSNGITFGWIYSLVLMRRNWFPAVVWALLLETFAVVSPFGAVFGLQSYSGVVVLAYVAHLFYGVPLGVAVQNAEVTTRLHVPLLQRPATWALTACVVGVGVWMVNAVEPVAGRPPRHSGQISITDSAFGPGWTDADADSTLRVVNQSIRAVTVLLREPNTRTASEHPLAAGEELDITLSVTGIYQVGLAEREVRSVFVACRRAGDYRRETVAKP